MRSIIAFAVASMIWISPVGIFAGDACTAEGVPLQLAQASGCVAKCERAREQCFAQYRRSDMRSGNYITAEGHKICWSGFHECKKGCPRK